MSAICYALAPILGAWGIAAVMRADLLQYAILSSPALIAAAFVL